MSKLVEERDAEAAINLINFAYFKKVRERKCSVRVFSASSSPLSQVASRPKKKHVPKDGEGGDERGGRGKKRPRKVGDGHQKLPKRRPGDPGYDPYDFTSSESEEEGPEPPTAESHDQEEGAEPMDTASGHLSGERSAATWRESALVHARPLTPPGWPHSVLQ